MPSSGPEILAAKLRRPSNEPPPTPAPDRCPPLQDRVAACLMLLYAQPASRLVRLTADDITRDDKGGVFIRLGDPPTPVPEPFASMLLRLAAESPYAAVGTARWLFPGRWPRHPANWTCLLERISGLGIFLYPSPVCPLALDAGRPVTAH